MQTEPKPLRLSTRIIVLPKLAHFIGGAFTILYFQFLDPGTRIMHVGAEASEPPGGIDGPMLLFISVLSFISIMGSGLIVRRHFKRRLESGQTASDRPGSGHGSHQMEAYFNLPHLNFIYGFAAWFVIAVGIAIYCSSGKGPVFT